MVLALLNTLDFRRNGSELAERLVDSFKNGLVSALRPLLSFLDDIRIDNPIFPTLNI